MNETQFQKVNGDEWVQLKGQKIDDLKLKGQEDEKSYISHYLKSKFYGVKESTSSAPTVSLLPNAGGKFFRVINNNDSKNGDPERGRLIGSYQKDELRSHYHHIYGGYTLNASKGPVKNLRGAGDQPGAPSGKTGGGETRPRNIAVNAFVKIKRKCVEVSKSDIDLKKRVRDNERNIMDLNKKLLSK